MSQEVKHINPNGVAALAKDVQYLVEFVGGLENAFMLQQNLDELQQTVALMQTDNVEEFYDVSTRNRKYGRVNALNGPVLLEKYVSSRPVSNLYTNSFARLTHSVEGPNRTAQAMANFSSRFGLR